MEMRKVMEYALAEFGRLGKGAKSETHLIYVEQSREYMRSIFLRNCHYRKLQRDWCASGVPFRDFKKRE